MRIYTATFGMLMGVALAFAVNGFGQMRLPGGITINGPRESRGRGLPQMRPEQAAPDQVCPKMIAWIQVLQNEYPGVDLVRTPSGRLQQMAVPLFADDVFEKQFGVEYPNLSDSERRDFFRTHIIPCQTSRKYYQQTIVLQVFHAPFEPGTAGMGPLSPGQLIPALRRLQAARSTLGADERTLRTSPVSSQVSQHATELLETRKDELSLVWPSERARFETVVNDAATRYAARAHSEPSIVAVASSGGASARPDLRSTESQGSQDAQPVQAAKPDMKRDMMSAQHGWVERGCNISAAEVNQIMYRTAQISADPSDPCRFSFFDPARSSQGNFTVQIVTQLWKDMSNQQLADKVASIYPNKYSCRTVLNLGARALFCFDASAKDYRLYVLHKNVVSEIALQNWAGPTPAQRASVRLANAIFDVAPESAPIERPEE